MSKKIFLSAIIVILSLGIFFAFQSQAVPAPDAVYACRGEGESIPLVPNAPSCCEGLTLIPPKFSDIEGIIGFCTAKCGDGSCDSQIETAYNCPQDCQEGTCVPEGVPWIEDDPNHSYYLPDGKCCNGMIKKQHYLFSQRYAEQCVGEPTNAYVCVYCGDGACGRNESSCNCPEDCSVIPDCIPAGGTSYVHPDFPVCCEGLEHLYWSTPDYWGLRFGKNECPPGPPEGQTMCGICGDGICYHGENKCNCPADCQETVSAIPGAPAINNAGAVTLEQITADAVTVVSGNVEQVIAKMGVTRDVAAEANYNETIVSKVVADSAVTIEVSNTITNFVTYGTKATKVLGAGERAGVVNSFKAAYGTLPTTLSEWNDVVKIANGRWPSVTSETAENKATETFKKIYLRSPDMLKPYDNAAVTVMAYGLRSADRNLDSERAAIKIFKDIYKYTPTSATDWDAVRAISYSGATR